MYINIFIQIKIKQDGDCRINSTFSGWWYFQLSIFSSYLYAFSNISTMKMFVQLKKIKERAGKSMLNEVLLEESWTVTREMISRNEEVCTEGRNLQRVLESFIKLQKLREIQERCIVSSYMEKQAKVVYNQSGTSHHRQSTFPEHTAK